MRDPATGWITLSAPEFFLLWWSAGLGEPPAGLGIPHVGRTEAQRAELVEHGSAALAGRDLGSITRPEDDIRGILQLLASAPRRAWLHVDGPDDGPDDRFVGLVATGTHAGAGAAVTGGDIRIGHVRPTDVTDVLTDALAPLPGGQGRPANVDWSDYLRACAAGEGAGTEAFLRVLRDAGLRQPEAHTVLRATTSRLAGGSLAACGIAACGIDAEPAATLSWVDTVDGRYALRRRGAWLTVTPADPTRLTAMIKETLQATHQAGSR